MRLTFLSIICFLLLLLTACKKTDLPVNNPTPPPVSKVPEVVTNNIANLSRFLVTISAKIIDTGSSKITEHGFVLDTLAMPDITKNWYKLPVTLDSINTFSLTLKDLPANKTYYLRTYAINSKGVGYGNQVQFNSFSENYFNGNITLHSQEEVIAFGANKYTRITGELRIEGPVTDLSPLLGLSVVENGFFVLNTQLVNFKGLDSLEYTGYFLPNNFRVEGNDQLVNFSGLSNLKITRGYFYVLKNNSLQNLDGLDSYYAAGAGDLAIRECNKLQNIDGLKKLEFVGGNVEIYDNPMLTNIRGLGKLNFIGFRLNIVNNAALQNLDGLEKIESLPWGVEIANNSSLTEIQGLSNLNNVQDPDVQLGSIVINGNPLLKELTAFSKITSADYLYIQNSPSLTNLSGFNNIESVKIALKIENNPGLLNLGGLEKLTTLSNLEIINNDALINLQGLNALSEISKNPYSLNIFGNKSLQSLSGIEHLSVVTGTISISGNAVIADFCPIKPLLATGYFTSFMATGNLNNPSVDEIRTGCP